MENEKILDRTKKIEELWNIIEKTFEDNLKYDPNGFIEAETEAKLSYMIITNSDIYSSTPYDVNRLDRLKRNQCKPNDLELKLGKGSEPNYDNYGPKQEFLLSEWFERSYEPNTLNLLKKLNYDEIKKGVYSIELENTSETIPNLTGFHKTTKIKIDKRKGTFPNKKGTHTILILDGCLGYVDFKLKEDGLYHFPSRITTSTFHHTRYFERQPTIFIRKKGEDIYLISEGVKSYKKEQTQIVGSEKMKYFEL